MPNYSVGEIIFSYIVLAWVTIWKGIALWKAAKYEQRNWFFAILLLNPPIFVTFGLLEIVYLFGFAKKRMKLSDIKTWFKDTFFSKSNSK